MSREEAVDLYLQGRIDRRMFVRLLVAAGVTAASATTYAQVLAPERAAAAPRPMGIIGNDYGPDGVFQVVKIIGRRGTGNRRFMRPQGVEYDNVRDRLYVADTGNHCIKVFDANGGFIRRFGTKGKKKGQFIQPTGVAIDPVTGDVLVSDNGNSRVQRLRPNGNFLDRWGSEGTANGQFVGVAGLTVDGSGNVYVADIQNSRVQKFSADGTHLMNFEPGFASQPGDVAVAGNGDVYVAAMNQHVIKRFDAGGTETAIAGTLNTPGIASKFAAPSGVALTPSYLYVADRGNHRAKRVDLVLGQFAVNAVSTRCDSYPGDAGDDGLKYKMPWGIATSDDGFVFVADTQNHRIVKLTQ